MFARILFAAPPSAGDTYQQAGQISHTPPLLKLRTQRDGCQANEHAMDSGASFFNPADTIERGINRQEPRNRGGKVFAAACQACVDLKELIPLHAYKPGAA